MSRQEQSRQRRCGDVRLKGFSDRASFEEAIAWLDVHARPGLPAQNIEEVSVDTALGRVLAEPIGAPADIPAMDSAAVDGYALRSAETEGATDYNPLLFTLTLNATLNQPSHPLPLAGAAMVSAGTPLPGGADAVLPFDATQLTGTTLEIFAAVAAGSGVERRGQQVRAGTALLEARRILRPQDAGLLASVGIDRVRVARLPRVRLVIAGPKRFTGRPPTGDANGPMLRGLIERDGGMVVSMVVSMAETMVETMIETMHAAKPRCEAIGKAIATPGADVILVAGRTGTGLDDEAPLALAKVGELAIHGVALRPGGSAGMGLAGSTPVLLLPGDPLGCWCAYELLAGRLIRSLGGRSPELPQLVREAEVGRKIVSAIGFVDLCRVRLVDGRVEPVGSAEFGSLASSVRADGFVVIPASLEGYAPGTRVKVHLD
jgi:molybdopterin molybdotransferase